MILDGFDEMTADLSPTAITANLRDIRSCLSELPGSKVLITSRQRVLEGFSFSAQRERYLRLFDDLLPAPPPVAEKCEAPPEPVPAAEPTCKR